jgi:type VI secretion system protein ImpK
MSNDLGLMPLYGSTGSAGAPSLFASGEIGRGSSGELASYDVLARVAQRSLVDLMYDGFYLIFLLRNGYVPESATSLREKLIDFFANFERQARRAEFSADNIHDAKYAYCALVDETLMTQCNPEYETVQTEWGGAPLQLSLFGSQLAGEQVFTMLENLRGQGAIRLPALEVFHFCLLLGFHGKYRLEAPEKINYLIARLGDEITFLKGKKQPFAPFWAIPDQIKHTLRSELPMVMILLLLGAMTMCAFVGLDWFLHRQNQLTMASYNHLIVSPEQQANITVYLP